MITKRKSFTLIELLIVLSILGILLAEVLPEINSAVSRSRASKCSSNLRVIQSAKAAYLIDHLGAVSVSPTDTIFLSYFPGGVIPPGCPSSEDPSTSPYQNVGELYQDVSCPNNCPPSADINDYPFEPNVGGPNWYKNSFHDLGDVKQ